MIFKPWCFALMLVAAGTGAHASSKSEVEVGQEIVALYLGAAGLYPNEELQSYVQSIGEYLTVVKGIASLYDWKFAVLDSPGTNAFAAPGGYILITKGLFDQLQSEDSLAFVLAHEIHHVYSKHHLKVIQNQAKMTQVIASMQNNLNLESSMLEDMNALFKDVALKGLDKAAEYESDVAGLQLSVQAGYSSSSAFDVLFGFAAQQSDPGNALFFKTHPTPADRIDVLSSHLSQEYEARDTLSPYAQRINNYK